MTCWHPFNVADDFASGKLWNKPENAGAGHTSKAHSSTAKVDISASAPKHPGPSAAGSTPASVPKNDAVVGKRDEANVKTSDRAGELAFGFRLNVIGVVLVQFSGVCK